MKKYINILLEYCKVRITFFVSISCALGFILANGTLSTAMILPVVGVFILSCGASAFNQWQEYKTDSQMNRTRNRPIPVGQLSIRNGFSIALSFTIIGLALLFLTGIFTAFALGIIAIFWYNLLYTPLKRRTSLAFFPGALIGSIPPAIGWVAGGGSLADPQLTALALFFFIWQIPHFWLLLLIYEQDYKRAGFPVLTDIFNQRQMLRMAYVWIVAMSVIGIIILFFGATKNIYTFALIIIAGIILLWRMKRLLNQNQPVSTFKFAFMEINFYVLAVTLLLSFDKLIS